MCVCLKIFLFCLFFGWAGSSLLCTGLLQLPVSGDYFLVIVSGLLIAVASLVVEQGLYGETASVIMAPGLLRTGSAVAMHRLSCSMAYGLFPAQGSNLWLLHWPVASLPLSHQGALHVYFFKMNFTLSL